MSANLTITIPNWLDRIFAWPVLIYRKYKYGYTFRRIYLGQGLFTKVDPEDYYRFNSFNWCPKEDGQNIYAVRLAGNPKKRVNVITLHREIMNNPVGLIVDHRNNYGLDNRRDNLRHATHGQNMYNRKKTKRKTSSKYVGVCFNKRLRRWAVTINYSRNRKFLGYFDNEADAARAYDRAAIKYHADFARLNFSREDYVNEIRPS